jgi:hypothetical protein
MGVSGCTACQIGGPEALKAYDRAYQANLDAQAALVERLNEAAQARNIYENQPVAGATVGSIINISA